MLQGSSVASAATAAVINVNDPVALGQVTCITDSELLGRYCTYVRRGRNSPIKCIKIKRVLLRNRVCIAAHCSSSDSVLKNHSRSRSPSESVQVHCTVVSKWRDIGVRQ